MAAKGGATLMSVTQRHQKPGTWSLRFKANCPRSIYAAPNFFDHIVVTPTRMEPIAGFTDADILANAIYTGVVHTKPDQLSLEGAGLEWWLGTPQGAVAGFLNRTGYGTVGAQTLTTAITNYVMDGITSVQIGTINTAGVASVGNYQLPPYLTAREKLAAISILYGTEWKITPAAKLNAALAANLFTTTPTVVVTRLDDGQEGTYRGLAGGDLNTASDVQEYVNTAYVIAPDGVVGSTTASPYFEFFGTGVDMKRMIDAQNTASTTAAVAIAAAASARLAVTRRNITIGSNTYSVGRFVQPGDYVYVWDQASGLTDAAVQIMYRGELISPISLRVYALTWPLQLGMGVYLRNNNGLTITYTDLSDFVEWENGEVQWEVGATDAQVSDSTSFSSTSSLGAGPAIVARSAPKPNPTYTATLTAATVNPNLGAAGSAVGYYTLDNGWCHWEAIISSSGAGAAAGTGQYSITLPIAPLRAGTLAIVGHGWFFNGGFFAVQLDASTGGTGCRIILPTTGALTSANPAGGFVVGSFLSVSGRYRYT